MYRLFKQTFRVKMFVLIIFWRQSAQSSLIFFYKKIFMISGILTLKYNINVRMKIIVVTNA